MIFLFSVLFIFSSLQVFRYLLALLDNTNGILLVKFASKDFHSKLKKWWHQLGRLLGYVTATYELIDSYFIWSIFAQLILQLSPRWTEHAKRIFLKPIFLENLLRIASIREFHAHRSVNGWLVARQIHQVVGAFKQFYAIFFENPLNSLIHWKCLQSNRPRVSDAENNHPNVGRFEKQLPNWFLQVIETEVRVWHEIGGDEQSPSPRIEVFEFHQSKIPSGWIPRKRWWVWLVTHWPMTLTRIRAKTRSRPGNHSIHLNTND